ncbi:DUF4254 domain-containing protein [Nocardia sp. NPDC003963]
MKGIASCHADRKAMPVGAASEPDSLFPARDDLLAAIRGDHIGHHPLARIAHQLGRSHHRHLREPARAGRHRRIELAREADRWVAERMPPPHPAASLHAESIGTVIDRLAQQQVRAYHLLMTMGAGESVVHAAWYRLAELIDDYTDLVTAVADRARYLPNTPIA